MGTMNHDCLEMVAIRQCFLTHLLGHLLLTKDSNKLSNDEGGRGDDVEEDDHCGQLDGLDLSSGDNPGVVG